MSKRIAGRRAGTVIGMALSCFALAACDEVGTNRSGSPAPPEHLQVWYYAHAVHLQWELHPQWHDEFFRVYGRRTTDASWFFVAEVSNCRDGICSYTDINISPGRTYEYYVASVDPRTGSETATEFSHEVAVPQPVPPPVPDALDAVPLDGAIYLAWGDASRTAGDFAFYRIYIEGDDGSSFLLGETDSEGFLDLLVQNGSTYAYFVTSVDSQGHESSGSVLAEATPRPDFHGEFIIAFEDRPDRSGFRFRESETVDPILPGTSPDRHFRLEADEHGWWLVPAPGVQVHGDAFATSALRCGPAADAGCTDLRIAPATGYGSQELGLGPGLSYVIRVPAGGGEWRYGVIRVSHVGFSQEGAVALFDWAFQLQPGNRALSAPPRAVSP